MSHTGTKTSRLLVAAGIVSVLFAASCGRDAPTPSARDEHPARKITVLRLNQEGDYVNDHLNAMRKALAAKGLEEGRDYSLKFLSAQNDLATLAQLVAAAKDERPEMLVAFQGPTLYAAMQRAPELKKVFAIVTDPFALGAGRSNAEHAPNVTGVYQKDPVGPLFDAVRQCMPLPKRIGTLFLLGDQESVVLKDEMARLAADRGLELIAQPYTTSGEMNEALRALEAKGVDALVPVSDPYQSIVYALMAKASRDGRKPLFGFWALPGGGASLICEASASGAEKGQFGELAARVFAGEDPTKIPFVDASGDKPIVSISEADAKRCGLTIPDAVRKNAKILGK